MTRGNWEPREELNHLDIEFQKQIENLDVVLEKSVPGTDTVIGHLYVVINNVEYESALVICINAPNNTQELRGPGLYWNFRAASTNVIVAMGLRGILGGMQCK